MNGSSSGIMRSFRSKYAIAGGILVATLMSGCASCPPVDPHLNTIVHFSDHMIPLSKAVDVVVDQIPLASKDDEIFSEVLKRSGDPELFKPFNGYVLRVKIVEYTGSRAGVILLCSPSGKEGIIEDVTCTTRPDTSRPTGSPCDFLLDVEKVCSAP